MTADEVILVARKRVGDNVSQQYRYDDESLLLYLDMGHRELLQNRPESHTAYTASGSPVNPRTINTISAKANVLQIQDKFKNTLAFYVCSMALQNDNMDAANLSRSQIYMSLYDKGVQTL